MARFTNRLAKESSPYLLQHAHNPVDWYPWSEEALAKAKTENKPILVSIGYAACHWCHVMEHESFEDEAIASIMNANFICIKIDREERPDLDHIYMDALQAMVGNGGWPLNVFLTPEGKPFYGGTYFPPKPIYNRPSWKDVLLGVAESFAKKREEITAQANNLTDYLIQSNSFGQSVAAKPENDYSSIFNNENVEKIYNNILQTADKNDGGFGRAPKFPQTFSIQFLLQHYYFTRNETALQHACFSLDKMIAGGIYDQLGGGFARYSTDAEWLAPHFEKMLYDNALLITTLSEAYQLTKKELYKDVIIETMEFIRRELYFARSAFYSSLDADSEGEEGKYYVWDKAEVDEILKEDSELFCSFYNITEKGNWEGKNILRVLINVSDFAKEKNLSENDLKSFLESCKKKLFEKRNQRIRPMLDDKILLSWNALMNIACSKAFAALGIEEYKKTAISNMDFLLKNFQGNGLHYFYHSFKNNEKKSPAFLDDYAFLVHALLYLQEITSDTKYLHQAKQIAEFVIENFSDDEAIFFYFTHKSQQDIIVRKKEIYDGATASGNAVMAFNLLQLSVIFDIPEWKERVIRMCSNLSNTIIKYPTSFAVWATLIQQITYGIVELVITGENLDDIQKPFLSTFIPNKIYQSTTLENEEFPILKGKIVNKNPLIFICKDYACQNPVTELSALVNLLENVHKYNVKPIQ